MEFPMDFLEFRVRHMCIDLCGRDRSMSEEFLDGTDIGTISEQGSGEAMPECVSRNLFYDIRPERIFLDLIGDEEPAEPYIFI